MWWRTPGSCEQSWPGVSPLFLRDPPALSLSLTHSLSLSLTHSLTHSLTQTLSLRRYREQHERDGVRPRICVGTFSFLYIGEWVDAIESAENEIAENMAEAAALRESKRIGTGTAFVTFTTRQVCVCVCVCVTDRQRQRQRQRKGELHGRPVRL